MSDADLLRRAATLARETANAATADVCPDWTWLAVRHVARNCDLECPTHGNNHEQCNQWDRHNDSPHIALWHPGVALAVAEWLDNCAAAASEWWNSAPPGAAARDPELHQESFASMYHYPLAVARALLGEDT